MTFDQVREGLGFMPFNDYFNCPERLAWVSEMQKRTTENISFRARGTTTRMICAALTYLSVLPDGENVYIKGHDPNYSRTLCYMAREYAERLGLNPMSIQPFYRDTEYANRRSMNLFVDHYDRLGV